MTMEEIFSFNHYNNQFYATTALMTEYLDHILFDFLMRLSSDSENGTIKVLGNKLSFQCAN